ncbi:MAG: DUF2155 domain-containing protein [Nitrospirae bacterium]|nr:DUF2155 domain-containing protein [Nitrospirota bacterium]
MKKFLAVSAVAGMILLSVVACKKKEEQPVPKTFSQEGQAGAPALPPGHGPTGSIGPLTVSVPPDVKGKWSAVKLIIDDKKTKKTQEYTVGLSSELKIPDSNLTVKVSDFLPDFKMNGNIITSASNNANNPAAGISVYESGKQIFPGSGEGGWLYAKFPNIHPFQHDRFGITLKEGVKK